MQPHNAVFTRISATTLIKYLPTQVRRLFEVAKYLNTALIQQLETAFDFSVYFPGVLTLKVPRLLFFIPKTISGWLLYTVELPATFIRCSPVTVDPSQLRNFRICPQAISTGEITLTRIRQFHINVPAPLVLKTPLDFCLVHILPYEFLCPPEPSFDGVR